MDMAIMLGNTISISCEAEGYPIPAIKWFKGQGMFYNKLKNITVSNNPSLIETRVSITLITEFFFR